jgi:hypothetical protein
MARNIGNSVAGNIPFVNDVVLSGHFQKKVITVNYDFPGYLYATAPAVDPSANGLQANNIFYREATSPGKYAPLLLCIVYANSTTQLDMKNNDASKLGSGSAALLHFFDNSAAVWASGTNDRNRYVSAIGAADSAGAGYARNTINGSLSMTVENTVDAVCAAVDAGVVDFQNYVIVDQAIDFRSTAKPSAISADFAIDALYVARINQRMLNGYDVFPSAFLGAMKAGNMRLMLDNPQI